MTEEEKREKARLKRAAYYATNRDRIRANGVKYYAANREKILKRVRTYTASNRGKEAARARKRLYGLSQDQFDALLSDQSSACAICRTAEPGGKGNFHVDHCHTTGKVRGLLCNRCNVGLGYFRESATTLQHASNYLAAHSAL